MGWKLNPATLVGFLLPTAAYTYIKCLNVLPNGRGQLLTTQVCRRPVDTTFWGPVGADVFISLSPIVTAWRTWSQKIEVCGQLHTPHVHPSCQPLYTHRCRQHNFVLSHISDQRGVELQTRLKLFEYHPGLVPPACLQLSCPCAISLEDCKCTYQIKAEPDIFVTKSMQIHLLRQEAMEPGQVWTKWRLFCLYFCVSCVCSLNVIQQLHSTFTHNYVQALSGSSKYIVIANAVNHRQMFSFYILYFLEIAIVCKNKIHLFGYSSLHVGCNLSSHHNLAHFSANEKKLSNISKKEFFFDCMPTQLSTLVAF